MKWSNYKNIIVFIQESEQRPLKANVAKCVHCAYKWNTHYAWSKHNRRGRGLEQRRKGDANAAFHLLKGQQQRKRHLALLLPCPNVITMRSEWELKSSLCEEKFTQKTQKKDELLKKKNLRLSWVLENHFHTTNMFWRRRIADKTAW